MLGILVPSASLRLPLNTNYKGFVRRHSMLAPLTAKILEQPHTAREYLLWARALIAAAKAEPDGLRQIRLRIGLAKNLMEEALPIGHFATHFFGETDDVVLALKVGNQAYDATVVDARPDGSGIEYIEVTVASEGEIDYLRMLALHETGSVFGLGPVTKSGTRKTGLSIKVEAEAMSQEHVLATERRIISEAIDRKSGKAYPKNTALIIALDDTMAHDRADNQANIVSVLREKSAALQGFRVVAVVGLVAGAGLFLSETYHAT